VSYNSPCRACDHKHDGEICRWQIHKTGRIELKPVYSDSLWGVGPALHQHGKDEDGKETTFKLYPNTYKDETFEYKIELDCGCRCYIPSENLEFLEWKYNESTKSA